MRDDVNAVTVQDQKYIKFHRRGFLCTIFQNSQVTVIFRNVVQQRPSIRKCIAVHNEELHIVYELRDKACYYFKDNEWNNMCNDRIVFTCNDRNGYHMRAACYDAEGRC